MPSLAFLVPSPRVLVPSLPFFGAFTLFFLVPSHRFDAWGGHGSASNKSLRQVVQVVQLAAGLAHGCPFWTRLSGAQLCEHERASMLLPGAGCGPPSNSG